MAGRTKKTTTAEVAQKTAEAPKLTPAQVAASHKWKSQMRAAIIKAHNDCNRKAIDRQRIADADVDNQVFLAWQADVDRLHDVVFNYVKKKKDARFDENITEAEVRAARELIYPKWKEILRYGDEYAKELHVREDDVEDLYKFAWEFFGVENKGTVETSAAHNEFRRNVEALLGCAIAANKVMSLTDKDIVDKYQTAQKNLESALKAMTDLTKTITELDDLLLEVEDGKMKNYLEAQKKIAEEELKKAEEKQKKAEKTIKKYAETSQRIADTLNKVTE